MADMTVTATVEVLTLDGIQALRAIPLVTGDTKPPLTFAWKDASGAAINLTGITPRLRLRMENETARLNDTANAMTVTSAVGGTSSYALTATDTVTPGIMEGELLLDYGAGVTWTCPQRLAFVVRRRT